jgi:hypothetical protein
MLNGVIDSREVKAQKAALSSQSSASTSSVCRRSKDELEIIRLEETIRQWDEYYAACFAQQQMMLQISWVILLQRIEQLGIILLLILCITTCIVNDGTTKIWHVTVRCSPLPPPFGSPPGAQVYLSQVGFHILFIDIKIFSINDMFYVIQLLHSPVGHDGGSSSHQNEPTLRGSSGHSNQPSGGNTWAFAWWLVHDVLWIDFVMDLMTLWWISWLCDGYHDCVMDLMNLWWIWWLLWCIMYLCDKWIESV